jgi:D-glycero-D-manno-heptose 1,7-bisphosphate phosphatase
MKRLIFLDRDGVLNELREDYVKSADELIILPGVESALSKLKEHGYTIVIISNQSVVGKGIITVDQLKEINIKINNELRGNIDDFYYCVHTYEDNCQCRKPGTLLFQQAASRYGVDIRSSWFIGDNTSDIIAGNNAGLRTILVRTGYGKQVIEAGEVKPDKIFDDLSAAVDWLIEND